MYKEIQSVSVAKSYMRKGFLIYEEMRIYFPIYEEAVSHISFYQCDISAWNGKIANLFLQCKRYIELMVEVNLFSQYCDVWCVVFSGYLLSMDVLGMLGRLARLLAGGDLTDVSAQPAKPTQGEPTTGSEVRLDISKCSQVRGKDSI